MKTLFGIILTTLLSIHCGSYSYLKTAQNIPANAVEIGLTVSGGKIDILNTSNPKQEFSQKSEMFPVEIWVNYGIFSRLQIGLNVFALGLKTNLQWQIIDSDFDLAVNVAVMQSDILSMGNSYTEKAIMAHLIATLPITEKWLVTFGPQFIYRHAAYQSDGPYWLNYFGGVINLGYKLSENSMIITEFGYAHATSGKNELITYGINVGKTY